MRRGCQTLMPCDGFRRFGLGEVWGWSMAFEGRGRGLRGVAPVAKGEDYIGRPHRTWYRLLSRQSKGWLWCIEGRRFGSGQPRAEVLRRTIMHARATKTPGSEVLWLGGRQGYLWSILHAGARGAPYPRPILQHQLR